LRERKNKRKDEICFDDIRRLSLQNVLGYLDLDDVKMILEKYSDDQIENMEGIRSEIVKVLKGKVVSAEEEVNEFWSQMCSQRYASMTIPKDLSMKIIKCIQKVMPKDTSFKPIFTCRSNNKAISDEKKKNWILDESDGLTYSDGRQIEARIKKFQECEVKGEFEKWLGEVSGKHDYSVADCKVIKGVEGCHRQEMHLDFDVDESKENDFMFGIVPLEEDYDVWVRPPGKRNTDEKEEIVPKGNLFWGNAPLLLHGGGTNMGARLHFMYVRKGYEQEYWNYKMTAFVYIMFIVLI